MHSFQHKKSSTPNSWAFPINFLSCAEIGSNCFADWEIGKIPQNSLSVPCWNENCKFGQNSMISQPNSQTTLFLLLFLSIFGVISRLLCFLVSMRDRSWQLHLQVNGKLGRSPRVIR